MFNEHNLGNIATRGPLKVEEERILVQRVHQRYQELNKDNVQLKVQSITLFPAIFFG